MNLRSRSARRAFVLLAVLATFLACAAVAWGLPPFTTGPKSAPPGAGGQAELFAIAAGCHPTFDRFVVRGRLATPGYRVRYVARVVQDGSGAPVSLLGRFRLHLVIEPARAHTEAGAALFATNVLTPPSSNLRQIKLAGD